MTLNRVVSLLVQLELFPQVSCAFNSHFSCVLQHSFERFILLLHDQSLLNLGSQFSEDVGLVDLLLLQLV